jgi:hypothetical protein
MLSILPFIVATILVGLTSARIAYRTFPYQPMQSLLSFLSLFWVIVTVLQLVMGVAGFLSPIAILASCVAFSLGEWLWSRVCPRIPEGTDRLIEFPRHWRNDRHWVSQFVTVERLAG